MKKKIIFFHPYSVYGGADLSISKLIDSTPKDFSIDFITLSKKPKINFYTKRKINIIKIACKSTLFSIFKLRDIIKKKSKFFNKIILLSNQNFANILALISSLNVKNVKNISFERNHISELDNSDTKISKLKNIIIKLLIKITYRYSDLIIGNSKELCNDLEKFVGRKVVNLYNFYDYNFIKKKAKSYLKKKIKFNKNIIINVGRLVDQKNQILLLKSFKIVNRENKDINLLIIGDGKKFKKFREYIIHHNLDKNIQILRNIKNALPYIKKSDLYVSTSKYEGFPNVIIEATALEVPTISTKYKSGLSEILLNGKGGLLISKKSPQIIAKNIINHFSNKKFLKKKMQVSKKNLKRFNYKFGVEKYQKIIRNL
tara:strand:+ start:3881 stop:4996 length:1116 start_codon:yes stop_codon:yes gene_type:complete